jgi:hypothetical protein
VSDSVTIDDVYIFSTYRAEPAMPDVSWRPFGPSSPDKKATPKFFFCSLTGANR